ncbi:MAG: glycosyltransferase [Microbacterium sp.]
MSAVEVSPSFAHLAALTDAHGVFEHALLDIPRREHGYCVDDVARALIVLIREPDQTPALAVLTETCLRFVEDAVAADGRVRNRMAVDGRWTDEASLGDWWGRAVWALGVTAAHATSTDIRGRALTAFHRAADERSPFGRALVFAALGAAAVLTAFPTDLSARALLLDGVSGIALPSDGAWEWPESRLRYANAAVPEALLAAGVAMDDPRMLSHGLSMLRFLVTLETRDHHLSVTGTSGRGPTQHSAQFDQQPIEVAALAEASARAFEITAEPEWRDVVASAWAWFEGDNDSATVMYDTATGAGFDGLERDGRNENRGAESTIAALSTYQQARRLGVLKPVLGSMAG